AIDAMMKWVRVQKDHNFEAIVYEKEVAKLGASALATIAILKHREVTGEDRWMDHAEAFARFLLYQQQENGRFDSKYFFGNPSSENFESIYYPGEAILALTRMQAVHPEDPQWERTASLGAKWLITVRDAGKKIPELTHDHWLLIATNELYPHSKSRLQLEHA